MSASYVLDKVKTGSKQIETDVQIDSDIPINSTADFFRVVSSVPQFETPVVTGYNANTGTLHVGGLAPDTTRRITVYVRYPVVGYKPGTQVSWQMIVHNGDGLKTKLLQVTTDPNETVSDIPLDATLANNGMLDIVSLNSQMMLRGDNGVLIPDTSQKETLEIIAYNAETKQMTIKGFTPESIRILRVVYRTVSEFTLKTEIPDTMRSDCVAVPGSEQWLSIEPKTLMLKPMENAVVDVTLVVPPGTDLPYRWSIGIRGTEKPLGETNAVSQNVSYLSEVVVTMRQ